MNNNLNNAIHSEKTESLKIQGGKFLTFFLGEEEYGFEILRVREIIGLVDITPVPRTPDFVKGIINLRGKIIPVIDLRMKMGMTEIEATRETCILVSQISDGDSLIIMGVLVDKVFEVLDIQDDKIGMTPEFGVEIDTDFILGIADIEGRMVIILDVKKILNRNERVVMETINQDIS